MHKNSQIAVIGSGFAGLSAAALLGSKGFQVRVFEKNQTIGGRARQLKEKGFTFDMGPSWYWMPDVIEQYFQLFGFSTTDFFDLKQLDPGFQMIFQDGEVLQVPANWNELTRLFELHEKGSGKKLDKFMEQAATKYHLSVGGLMHKPSLSLKEYVNREVFAGFFNLQLFSSYSTHIRSFFKNPKLISLMEFPILFLGAMPDKTPALYSLMNYAGIKLGTHYPMGGFGKLVSAMKEIASGQGVDFSAGEPVNNLEVKDNQVTAVNSDKGYYHVDGVIGAADYHHIEQNLLPGKYRNYDLQYWNKRTLAPSCLLFYLGVNKKINKLLHHNLFFDQDLLLHGADIYQKKCWPSNPLFYVCCPSKTDPSMAPPGKDALTLLMPVAPGLQDSPQLREHYYRMLLTRLEKFTKTDIQNAVEYKKDYCIADFIYDYNAFKGNGYGLANTLKQTAMLKPRIKSKHLKNLFFAGQMTVPGPGVPPSIISGQIAAKLLTKSLTSKNEKYL